MEFDFIYENTLKKYELSLSALESQSGCRFTNEQMPLAALLIYSRMLMVAANPKPGLLCLGIADPAYSGIFQTHLPPLASIFPHDSAQLNLE